MSEYTDEVARRRLKIRVDEWRKGVKSIYAEAASDGSFMRITYNDDSVKRLNEDGTISFTTSPHDDDSLVWMFTHGESTLW
jgi:hypothetical protein